MLQQKSVSVIEFIDKRKDALILDVRAPIEYVKGHIPGAINIPLFEDIERAEIGTLYKQQGKDLAIQRGLELVSPKMSLFVQQVKSLAQQRRVHVYCFRGGMRSNSFAWLMNTAGIDAVILSGGYKAYRNHVLATFEQKRNWVLLGGNTGSGKTDILKVLHQQKFQVIDLEALAHHKGSAFGSINEPKQLPQQQFEHHLYQAFVAQNPEQPILLEDESQTIGFNKIPYSLWLQMKQAPLVKIEIPFELRIQQLLKDYSTIDIPILKISVLKIAEKLGPEKTKQCLQHLDEGNLIDVARLALYYYDKTYEHLYQQKKQPMIHLASDTIDAQVNAEKVKEILLTL